VTLGTAASGCHSIDGTKEPFSAPHGHRRCAHRSIDHDKWLLILWYYVQELANRKPRSQVVDVAQEDAIAALGVVRMKQAVNNGACIDLIVEDQALKLQDVQRCFSFSSCILKQVQVRRPSKVRHENTLCGLEQTFGGKAN
jgi:hypothetical protein